MIDITGITDFLGFLWKIISTLADGIVEVVNFVIGLITILPDFLSILPNEIKVLFVPVLTLAIFVFVYKLVK